MPQETELENEKPEDEVVELTTPTEPAPVSIDLNAKDAITYLRKLHEISDVESFVKMDKRVTVKRAATSRINAIERKRK